MKKVWILSLVLAALGCSDAPEQAGSAAAGAAPHPGEKVYQQYCFSCHTPGISGAPRLGDAEAWAPRIAKGRELLLQTTIEGIGSAMPARGLCSDCSDQQLADAIDYMIQENP